jgi:hypothetical protein
VSHLHSYQESAVFLSFQCSKHADTHKHARAHTNSHTHTLCRKRRCQRTGKMKQRATRRAGACSLQLQVCVGVHECTCICVHVRRGRDAASISDESICTRICLLAHSHRFRAVFLQFTSWHIQHTWAGTHTHTYAHRHTHIHTRRHTHIHTHTGIHTYTLKHTPVQTHTHTCTHIYTHTHTHTAAEAAGQQPEDPRKRYSKDFMRTLAQQCIDRPVMTCLFDTIIAKYLPECARGKLNLCFLCVYVLCV